MKIRHLILSDNVCFLSNQSKSFIILYHLIWSFLDSDLDTSDTKLVSKVTCMNNHKLALTALTEPVNSKAADSWCEVSSRGHGLVWQKLTEPLPPRLPPFLLIFLLGVLFHPTQHIVFITLAPPLPIRFFCPLLLTSSCSHTIFFFTSTWGLFL